MKSTTSHSRGNIFVKCHLCQEKPATIRYINTIAGEKRVCYSCEKKFQENNDMKMWNKEMIPYNEMISPTKDVLETSPLNLKNEQPEKLIENDDKQKTQNISNNNDTKEQVELPDTTKFNPNEKQTTIIPRLSTPSNKDRQIKSNLFGNKVEINEDNRIILKDYIPVKEKTPIFFSEYLKEYRPGNQIKNLESSYLKNSLLQESKRSVYPMSPSLSLSQLKTEEINNKMGILTSNLSAGGDKGSTPTYISYRELLKDAHNNNDKFPRSPLRVTNGTKSEVNLTNPSPRTDRKQVSFRMTPQKNPEISQFNNDTLDKKIRDVRKEEIRQKINRLSEKFYSPDRLSIQPDSAQLDYLKTNPSYPAYNNVNKLTPKSILVTNSPKYSGRTTHDEKRVSYTSLEKTRTRNASAVESMNLNNIDNDLMNKLRDELRDLREDLSRERLNNANLQQSATKEARSLREKIKELEKNLEYEKQKNQNLQDELIEVRNMLDRKLQNDNKNKIIEKDMKIQDLNTQIKQLNLDHKNYINEISTKFENRILRQEEEANKIRRDLQNELELKNLEIEKLKRQEYDMKNTLTNKINLIEDALKSQELTSEKLRQTNELKSQEIEKFNKKMNEYEKKINLLESEIDFNEQERSRLVSENDKLRNQVIKLEKFVYGKSRESPLKI